MGENNKKGRRSLEIVMNSFTDDLWSEIFVYLPIKSLLQFKSVCKSWFSIISSHRFAKSHLATGAKDDEILIVHHQLGDFYEEDDSSFSLLHLYWGRIFKNLKFPYSQGEYPFDTTSKLIGSDCGIVCVSVDLYFWRAAQKKCDIYLWNPATKHSNLIPSYTIPDNGRISGTFGLGFDHIDLDFKLVRVLSCTLPAEVYSSNRNAWRKIESGPIDTPSSSFHVFNGFLFAIGYDNISMMAFNLNKEVFVCGIKLPVSSFHDDDSFFDIADVKDTIAVINTIVKERKIHLWTLDDETSVCSGGVEASWTKVLSVDLVNVIDVGVGVSIDFFDILFSNFQFLLIEKIGERYLYNWNTKVTTKVPIHPYLERDQYFKYTKSLFSLVGFKRVKWATSCPRLQDSSDSDE